jgi:hypothetical protein
LIMAQASKARAPVELTVTQNSATGCLRHDSGHQAHHTGHSGGSGIHGARRQASEHSQAGQGREGRGLTQASKEKFQHGSTFLSLGSEQALHGARGARLDCAHMGGCSSTGGTHANGVQETGRVRGDFEELHGLSRELTEVIAVVIDKRAVVLLAVGLARWQDRLHRFLVLVLKGGAAALGDLDDRLFHVGGLLLN